MKTLFFSLICLMTFSLSAQKMNYDIAADKAEITWVGKKVTGQHEGTIGLKSGSLVVNDGQIESGDFVIDMTSIKCTDLSGGGATKLEGHLASDDFFGVDNHPTATLKITEAARRGSTDNYEVTADLTIKGVTKPVEFIVRMEGEAAYADISVDRTQYGIKYGSGSFFDNLGDKMIYDNFDLAIKFSL